MLNIVQYLNIHNISIAKLCIFYILLFLVSFFSFKSICLLLIFDIHLYLIIKNFNVQYLKTNNLKKTLPSIHMDIQAEGISREIFDLKNVKREYFAKLYKSKITP